MPTTLPGPRFAYVTYVKCCQTAQYEKTGMQGQDTEVTGGRKQGRPWPKNGLQAIGGGEG